MTWRCIRSGVRDVMESEDSGYIIMIEWDNLSINDDQKVEIPEKGKVMTRLSEFWFELTKDICPNAFITSDNENMNVFFRDEKMEGRCILQHNLRMLPFSIHVHRNITGALWEEYNGQRIRTKCGQKLSEGLRRSETMPSSILVYTTRHSGVELDLAQANGLLHRAGFVINDDDNLMVRIKDYSLKLFDFVRNFARDRGVIIADAKIEFGIDDKGVLRVADQMFTTDVATMWFVKEFTLGKKHDSLDKSLILDFIKNNPGVEMKNLPKDVVDHTRRRILESYHLLTGKAFL